MLETVNVAATVVPWGAVSVDGLEFSEKSGDGGGGGGVTRAEIVIECESVPVFP